MLKLILWNNAECYVEKTMLAKNEKELKYIFEHENEIKKQMGFAIQYDDAKYLYKKEVNQNEI